MTERYISDEIGSLEDSVKLQLGNDEIRIAESWDIVEGVLSQPSAWSVSTGHSGVAAALLEKYPPKTPAKLFIGDVLQMSGFVEGRGASQPRGSGTSVRFKGRDALGPMMKTYVAAQESFNNATYGDLVRRALKACGLDPTKLTASNEANRAAKCGKRVVSAPTATAGQSPDDLIAAMVALLPDSTDLTRAIAQIVPSHEGEATGGGAAAGVVTYQQQAMVGETWLHFVRRHIDKAGLFLWATFDAGFVLSRPHGEQSPIARLVRHTGDPTPGANVLAMEFDDDTTHRHSECILYGRGGGKKHGRSKAKGGYLDEEMLAFGIDDQPLVLRATNIQNNADAEFFARRKLAEERREGWRLIYTIAGHTLPAIGGGEGDRIVLTPDTTIEVDDDEINVHDTLYVENVRRQRSPGNGTTTTIHLMRRKDLIFGGVEAE